MSEKVEVEAESCAALAGAAGRERGRMLWFNAAKDLGALETADGVRLEVIGTAIAPGDPPPRRCFGKTVEFQCVRGVVSDLTFVADVVPQRARRRGRRR